jgi:hypothetical protein
MAFQSKYNLKKEAKYHDLDYLYGSNGQLGDCCKNRSTGGFERIADIGNIRFMIEL